MIFHNIINNSLGKTKGNEDGAVVRAFASNQCGLGSNPGVDAICGLSLLLVLYIVPRGFSPRTEVSPSPTFPNSILSEMIDEESLCGSAASIPLF